VSRFELTRRYHFSAGHRLASPALSEADNARIYGQCYRPHGHNYELEVTVVGALDLGTGMSADLGQLDAVVQRALLDRVDHHDLSGSVPELAGSMTTGEELARTFWRWLDAELPPDTLRRVTVVETANTRFESAGDRRE
jgi:6-pyruvoyltetrahydropterin/6-carboxytetrahydropterin synthase